MAALLPLRQPHSRGSTPSRLARSLRVGFVWLVVLSWLHLFVAQLGMLSVQLPYSLMVLHVVRFTDADIPWFDAYASDGDLAMDYECIGWRQTEDGSPDGLREPTSDANCDFEIHQNISGFCLFKHKTTNVRRRVMQVYSDTMYRSATFKCSRAPELVTYAARSDQYVHDPNFSFIQNQQHARDAMLQRTGEPTPVVSFERGITMVIHGGVLASAYISIRALRETNSTLPVEMWFRRDEVDPSHPLLTELVDRYGVFVREMTDPRATKYFTKLYAVFYSAFDNVLLLDADNFAVRDPSYLFDTREYQSRGAVFWPDFWQPRQTTFNVQPHSLVWSILGVPFVDMFEQESGQVVINRVQHVRALNVLMFYGFGGPRVTEELQIAWGDKDLFRFAWMRSNSSFHYITTHAGSAGKLNTETGRFCGTTMVQHDLKGEVIFLHRNMQKLVAGEENMLVWTHIQQFKKDAPPDQYNTRKDKVFDDIRSCWANAEPDARYYKMTPFSEFPFRDLETRLLDLAVEAYLVEHMYDAFLPNR